MADPRGRPFSRDGQLSDLARTVELSHDRRLSLRRDYESFTREQIERTDEVKDRLKALTRELAEQRELVAEMEKRPR